MSGQMTVSEAAICRDFLYLHFNINTPYLVDSVKTGLLEPACYSVRISGAFTVAENEEMGLESVTLNTIEEVYVYIYYLMEPHLLTESQAAKDGSHQLASPNPVVPPNRKIKL